MLICGFSFQGYIISLTPYTRQYVRGGKRNHRSASGGRYNYSVLSMLFGPAKQHTYASKVICFSDVSMQPIKIDKCILLLNICCYNFRLLYASGLFDPLEDASIRQKAIQHALFSMRNVPWRRTGADLPRLKAMFTKTVGL